MNDPFFQRTHCSRCGNTLSNGRIMSMYNMDVICLACKKAETNREDYTLAVEADHEQIRKGNYNYEGIGY